VPRNDRCGCRAGQTRRAPYLHKQAWTAVVVVIDDGQRSARVRGQGTEGRGRCHPRTGPGFQGGSGWARMKGASGRVYLQRSSSSTVMTGLPLRWARIRWCSSSSRSASPPCGLPVELAELVMRRGVVGNGLDDTSRNRGSRRATWPSCLLRHAHLEVEGRHPGVNLPRLLERFRSLLRLVLPEEGAAEQVIRCRAAGVEARALPGTSAAASSGLPAWR
jgi:hypothetical protein